MRSDLPSPGFGLENLALLSRAKSRAINAENPTGAKGRGGMATDGSGAHPARDLGRGWKVSPSLRVPGRVTVTLADIEGPGIILHAWMTVENPLAWRRLVLRCYWDGEELPSVEVPLGDFFCNGWCVPCMVNSLPVAVNPKGGFNSFWPMPFRRRARITIENLSPDEVDKGLYYQIDYALTDVPDEAAHLHAQWRRSNPVAYHDVHTILDTVHGPGHYVGTYLAWGVNNDLWWSEGEVKFYLDGDVEWPTICGTGLEDYFGGAWTFEQPLGQYAVYSTPFMGLPQVLQADGSVLARRRFGMYRWHVLDPICFEQDIRVTVQSLGLLESGQSRYLPTQDDVASTAFWYQAEPHTAFPTLPAPSHLAA
jgi:hypothetical protein